MAPKMSLDDEYAEYVKRRLAGQVPTPATPESVATEPAPKSLDDEYAQYVQRRLAQQPEIQGAAPAPKPANLPINAPPDVSKGSSYPMARLGQGLVDIAYEAPSVAAGMGRSSLDFLKGLAQGVHAGFPAAEAGLHRALRPEIPDEPLPGEQRAAEILGPAPATRAQDRATMALQMGQSVGQMPAGFMTAGLTIPAQIWHGDIAGILHGLAPIYGEGKAIAQKLNDPTLDEAEKNAALEHFLAVSGPSSLIGTAMGLGILKHPGELLIKGLRERQARVNAERPFATAAAAQAEQKAKAATAPPPAAPAPEPSAARPAPEPTPAPSEPARAAPTPAPATTLPEAARTAAPPILTGKPTVVRTPAGDYNAVYELRYVDEVKGSHDGVTFARNPEVPPGVNERLYHSDKAEQNKVTAGASDHKPAFVLTDAPDAINGPPMVTSDKPKVIGGTSRHMMQERIAQGLGREGALGDYYNELVAAEPGKFGFDLAKLRQVLMTGRPVEVVRRLLDVSSDDVPGMTEAARRFNLDFKQGVSPLSAAVSRAKAMSQEGLDSIGQLLATVNPDESLRDALRGQRFHDEVLRVLQEEKIIPRTEINKFVDERTGMLDADMVESTLAGTVVPDAQLLATAPKSQINKVVKGLPSILQARAMGWDLGPDLDAALRINLKKAKLVEQTGLKEGEALRQTSMFGEEEAPSERAQALADALRDMGQRQFGEQLRRYASDARRIASGQLSMEEMMAPDESLPKTEAEAFNALIQAPKGKPTAVAAFRPRTAPLGALAERGAPPEIIEKSMGGGADSMSLYEGVPERAALREQIIREHMAPGTKAAEDEPPKGLYITGGWGSGKTTARKAMANDFAGVQADADALKERLPDFAAGFGKVNTRMLAMFLHEESSDLSKQIVTSAVQEGRRYVYDSVGKGAFVRHSMEMNHARGGKNVVLYVETDPDVAYQNAWKRANKPGARRRENPREDLYQSHQQGAAAAINWLDDPLVDEMSIFFNDGKTPPIKILEKNADGTRVFRQDLLQKVYDKAKMDVEVKARDDRLSNPTPTERAKLLSGQPVQGHPAELDQGDRGGERPAGAPGTGAAASRPAVQKYDPVRPDYTPPANPAEAAAIKGRHQIISGLADRLNITARLGRFRERAAGIFKTREEVIRLRDSTDLSAFAHEVGHLLEKRIWNGEVPGAVRAEMRALTKDVNGPHTESEALAEFIRRFMTNDAEARQFKGTYDAVTADLMTKAPEMYEAMVTARQDYARWANAPATARLLSEVSFDPPKERKLSIHDFYAQTMDDLHPIRYIVDQMTKGAPLKPGEDPYVLHRVLRGWAGKADMFLERGTVEFDHPMDPTGKPLREILEPIWKRRKDFAAYVLAKRSLELEARKAREETSKQGTKLRAKITPWDKETARQVVKEQQSGIFDRAAEQLQPYQDALLNYMRDSGAVSDDQVKTLKELSKNYVPLYRVLEGNEGRPYSIGPKRTVNLFAPIKRLFGSTLPVVDPIESIYKNTMAYVNLAERNATARSLIELAETTEGMGQFVEKLPTPLKPIQVDVAEVLKAAKIDLGIHSIAETRDAEQTIALFRPDLWSKRPNVVTVLRNGKPEFYQVHPDLYRTLMGVDREAGGFWSKLLAFPASTLRAGATLVPGFIQRNPVRDQWTAFVNSRYGFKPGVDLVAGFYHALKQDQAYWDYKASGAAYSSLVSMDRTYLHQNMNQLMASGAGRVARYAMNPFRLLQAASELGEEATRIMEVKRALAKEGRSREGATAAGYAGREVTVDFQRIGAKMVAVNHIAAFFNAGLQGGDRAVRQFKDQPVLTTAKVVAGVTVPSVLLWLVNHDQQWYKDKEQWEKDLYWFITPTVRIPKPFELGLLFGSFFERQMDFMFDEKPGAFDGSIDTLLRSLPSPMPTAMVPLIENMTNYSLFYDRTLIPRGEQELEPKFQYGPYTTETAKMIGEKLNVSPRKVENLVRGYGGGVGTELMRGADALVGGKVSPPARTAREKLLPAFTSRYPSFSSQPATDFYKHYDETLRAENSVRTLIKNKEREKAAEYRPTVEDLLGRGKHYRKAAEDLGQMRRQAARIAADPNITGDEKRRRLDELARRYTELARKASDRLSP